MKKATLSIMTFLTFCAFSILKAQESVVYEESWESLSKVNQTPEWFLDAKLGIYAHWGPTSEAFEGADPNMHYQGWHGMIMYQDGKKVPTKNGEPSNNYVHHKKKIW